MQDNNNNDNLFTQMFGLETEEPKIEEPKNPAEPVTQVLPNIPKEVSNPSPDATPKSEIKLEPETKIIVGISPQNNDLNKLNFSNQEESEVINLSSSETSQSLSNNEKVELSTNNQYDLSNYYSNTQNDIEDFTAFEESDIKNGTSAILKVFLILLIVLSLFGGWYFIYNIVLSSKEETLTENVPDNNTQTENIQVLEPVEVEEKIIVFDENLSFERGLTSNTSEQYQTVAYTPNDKTGVIKCSSTESISNETFNQDVNLYLYYENYQLKKTLQVSTEKYSTTENFQLGILIGEIFIESWEETEGIKYTYIPNSNTKEIQTTMLLNLAYGSYYPTNSQEYYIKSEYTYNENIKTAINKTLNLEHYKNKITCSTLET